MCQINQPRHQHQFGHQGPQFRRQEPSVPPSEVAIPKLGLARPETPKLRPKLRNSARPGRGSCRGACAELLRFSSVFLPGSVHRVIAIQFSLHSIACIVCIAYTFKHACVIRGHTRCAPPETYHLWHIITPRLRMLCMCLCIVHVLGPTCACTCTCTSTCKFACTFRTKYVHM